MSNVRAQYQMPHVRVSPIRSALFGLLVLLSQSCASSYSADPIDARVVNAETGQALDGVIVVAYWDLVYGLEGGGHYPLAIVETVTDQQGRFHFPAWGPKEIPKILPSEARLKDGDPVLILFKRDYAYAGLQNHRPIRSMSGHGASVRTSEWNGKQIPLKPFRGDLRMYEINLEVFSSALYFIHNGTNCEWTHIPRMIAMLSVEGQRLRGLNMRRNSLPEIDHLPNQRECGSATEIIGPFLGVQHTLRSETRSNAPITLKGIQPPVPVPVPNGK